MNKLQRFARSVARMGLYMGWRSGVSGRREADLVVSLTSIPERLEIVHESIESILTQTRRPDRVVLWLGEELSESPLPKGILRLQRAGLVIRFVKDIGPYCKLVPALIEFPEATIVTADDDVLYPRDWLERLISVSREYPSHVVCYRGTSILKDKDGRIADYLSWPEHKSTNPSLDLFPTGRDGVLYPPGCLSQLVLDVELFTRICPTNDDIWFKAMSLLEGTPCAKVAARHIQFPEVSGSQSRALHEGNVARGKNDLMVSTVFERFSLAERIWGTVGEPAQTPS